MQNGLVVVLYFWTAAGCSSNPSFDVPASRAGGVMQVKDDRNTADDEAAIRQLIGRYLQAVDAADTDLAAGVWSRGADVLFIHSRGHERGWEAVRESFYVKTMREPFSDRRLTVRDVAVRVSGDSAWAGLSWDFSATFRTTMFD